MKKLFSHTICMFDESKKKKKAGGDDDKKDDTTPLPTAGDYNLGDELGERAGKGHDAVEDAVS